MKAVLYMAISADGFIAGPDDETPWSDDAWAAFQKFVETCDVVLLGRRTYEIMREQDEFVYGPEYVVATTNPSFNAGKLRMANIQAKSDMPHAEKIGIIGGGELNGGLAKLGVIDEIILDVEPVALGAGKRLFGASDVCLRLSLIDSRRIGTATTQNHYQVVGRTS